MLRVLMRIDACDLSIVMKCTVSQLIELTGRIRPNILPTFIKSKQDSECHVRPGSSALLLSLSPLSPRGWLVTCKACTSEEGRGPWGARAAADRAGAAQVDPKQKLCARGTPALRAKPFAPCPAHNAPPPVRRRPPAAVPAGAGPGRGAAAPRRRAGAAAGRSPGRRCSAAADLAASDMPSRPTSRLRPLHLNIIGTFEHRGRNCSLSRPSRRRRQRWAASHTCTRLVR